MPGRMIESDHAAGKDEGGIGQGRLVSGVAATLGLELVAEPARKAALELEGQLRSGHRLPALQLASEPLEDRLTFTDTMEDRRAQRPTVVSHERKPSAFATTAAI